MKLFNWFKRKYASHPEAVIISCFFNPMNSPYRLAAFNKWYDSIKHLNHHVVECVIGDAKPQLPQNANISRIHTENLLWHKEALLNNIVAKLPKKYQYVFWVDADVLFTNRNWLTDSVKAMEGSARIVQPFEYCVHLNQDETKPSFNVDKYKDTAVYPNTRHPQVWRSFCANHVTLGISGDNNYDRHGHVGFAWGAQRSVLEACPLYDKALIGGADHIIAHAAAEQVPHRCIEKSFTDDLANVLAWSKRFASVVRGRIGYAKGDLYHLWHGDIDKRQYLKRIQDFTIKAAQIQKKDANGLFVTGGKDDQYVKNYFKQREVTSKKKVAPKAKPAPRSTPRVSSGGLSSTHRDDGFINSMGLAYLTDNAAVGMLVGGNPVGAILGSTLRDATEPTYDNDHKHHEHSPACHHHETPNLEAPSHHNYDTNSPSLDHSHSHGSTSYGESSNFS